MTLPKIPSKVHQQIESFAQQLAGEINGVQVTHLDAVLKTMKVLMKDKPEFAKILLQSFLEASKEQQEFKMHVLREALAHKEEWGPRFALAAKLGNPLPNVYPHPDDIVINPDNSVSFIGPVTAEDARALRELLEYRDEMFRVAQLRIDACGKKLSPEDAREIWAYQRRRYYRYFSKHIPKRYKRPFPRFEPN